MTSQIELPYHPWGRQQSNQLMWSTQGILSTQWLVICSPAFQWCRLFFLDWANRGRGTDVKTIVLPEFSLLFEPFCHRCLYFESPWIQAWPPQSVWHFVPSCTCTHVTWIIFGMPRRKQTVWCLTHIILYVLPSHLLNTSPKCQSCTAYDSSDTEFIQCVWSCGAIKSLGELDLSACSHQKVCKLGEVCIG